LRLDIGGGRHSNPDGEVIDGPHLHIYTEGYGDKWAYPLPDEFTDDISLMVKFVEFLRCCKIDNVNDLQLQGVI
jgi:hypothetical protein